MMESLGKSLVKDYCIPVDAQKINIGIGAEFPTNEYVDWGASALALDTNNKLFQPNIFFYNNIKSINILDLAAHFTAKFCCLLSPPETHKTF